MIVVTVPDVLDELKRSLKVLGWSQNKLARETGISEPFLNQMLNGKRRMDLLPFLLICQSLGILPSEVFTNAELKVL